MVTFIVFKDGKITRITVQTKISNEIETELIRVMSTSPKWNPVSRHGIPLNTKVTLPIYFDE